MDSVLNDWLGYLLRWVHLIAGISWIGSSFYFMWLDSHLAAPEKPDENVEGALWMVHSGGFYQVERRRIGPGQMPKTLHWFKWEAAFTWISGFFLLGLLYYLTDGAYLIDPSVSTLTAAQATGVGFGVLVVSWFVYDWMLLSPLGNHGKTAAAVCFGLLALVTYALTQLLSGRAAYIHVGALFGTLMVLNVWVRILPAQQQMIDATERGEKPDYTLSARAKRRSVHNSYMTFPVLFMMLSNHYPMTYGHSLNWLILLLLVVLGAGIRHAMIAKSKSGNWALVPATGALIALVVMTAPRMLAPHNEAKLHASSGAVQESVAFSKVHSIIQQRCVACHSANPTDRTFGPTPGGASFDTPEQIKRLAERIRFRAVDSKTMPLANKTGMTDEERELLGRWISQGAKLDEQR